jgi:hypothetical protein
MAGGNVYVLLCYEPSAIARLVHLPSSHELPQRAQSVVLAYSRVRCQRWNTVPRSFLTQCARLSGQTLFDAHGGILCNLD